MVLLAWPAGRPTSFRPVATDGSLVLGELPGTTRGVQVMPLSVDTTTPAPMVSGELHCRFGR